MKDNNGKVYSYCPYCKKEELNNEKLKVIGYGTDGYGQPVSITDCSCGNKRGFLYTGHYREDLEALDEDFFEYLKGRINFYLEPKN